MCPSNPSASHQRLAHLLAAATLAALLACMPAPAATLYVATCGNDSWTGAKSECVAPDGPKRLIQAAIDASRDGDEIIVAAGTYHELIDFIGKAVNLHSVEGPEQTIIDGAELSGSVITCSSGEGAQTVLDGFTVTGGSGTVKKDDPYEGYQLYGGGMYIYFSSPRVQNCAFADNTLNQNISGMHGGGIFCYHGNPVVTNCTFSRNRVGTGYARVTGAGMCSDEGNVIITNCVFSENVALANDDYDWITLGGGAYVHAGSATITHCVFTANEVSIGWGGGLYIESTKDTTVGNCSFDRNVAGSGGGVCSRNSGAVITDCTFTRNVAHTLNDAPGGGLFFSGSEPSNGDPVVRRCVFRQNSAETYGGGMFILVPDATVIDSVFERNGSVFAGGGITNGGKARLVNCRFTANNANFYGGAISNLGYANEGALVLRNCTVAANGSTYGGAIYGWGGALDIASCIFWGDAPSEILTDGGSISVAYSDVDGGVDGDGNIDADPLFVRAPNPGPDKQWNTDDDDYGDLRLHSDSPCIDAGDPSYIPHHGETDLAGLFRVWDGNADGQAIIDMGAYEFASHPYGDLNCDARIDFNDIDAFVTAITDPDEYAQLYPSCNILLADTNADGTVDLLDIDPFVDCLINSGCP